MGQELVMGPRTSIIEISERETKISRGRDKEIKIKMVG